MIVCGLLASGASTMAQSMDGRCSNRTIFGGYGSDSRGSLLPAPSVAIAFNGLTMTHFDGKGNLTWVEHEVVGGNPLNPGWLAASGTYSVNPDCTGLAVVITPNSPVPLNLYFVVMGWFKRTELPRKSGHRPPRRSATASKTSTLRSVTGRPT
jgi:hypothetical protein